MRQYVVKVLSGGRPIWTTVATELQLDEIKKRIDSREGYDVSAERMPYHHTTMTFLEDVLA